MKRQGTAMAALQRDIIDRLRTIGPMTSIELCDELGSNRENIRRAVNDLHAKEKVFVADWPYSGIQRARQWAFRAATCQHDAPRPPSLTDADWKRNYRHRNKLLLKQRKAPLHANPFAGLMV